MQLKKILKHFNNAIVTYLADNKLIYAHVREKFKEEFVDKKSELKLRELVEFLEEKVNIKGLLLYKNAWIGKDKQRDFIKDIWNNQLGSERVRNSFKDLYGKNSKETLVFHGIVYSAKKFHNYSEINQSNKKEYSLLHVQENNSLEELINNLND
jgi:hypothetical protein